MTLKKNPHHMHEMRVMRLVVDKRIMLWTLHFQNVSCYEYHNTILCLQNDMLRIKIKQFK